MVKRLNILLFIAILCGCDSFDIRGFFMPTSESTIEERFDLSMAWNNTHQSFHNITLPNDNYDVFVCADVHIEEEANSIKKLTSLQRNKSNSAFLIVLGDIGNYYSSIPLFYDAIALDTTAISYTSNVYTIPGNHDLYFNSWEQYYKYLGSSIYTVSVKTPSATDLFIFLDTAGGTLGSKQIKWLEDVLKNSSSYRNIIVSSHVNFFNTHYKLTLTSTLPLEETYYLTDLFAKYKVKLVLQGHDHSWMDDTYRDVHYLCIEPIGDRFEKHAYITVNVGDRITILKSLL